MAPKKGISKEKFNDIKAVVSSWYDRNKLVSMLKVVFKDHLATNNLSNATRTVDILNLLYGAGHLSPTDLTLLYETIELTMQEGLEEEIKEILPSIPNIRPIDDDSPFSRFSPYRQKIVMFGFELKNKDIEAIDGNINIPNMNYVDSWCMISDLEHRLIICEKDIEKFKGKLRRLKLDNARKVFEDDFIPNRKRNIQTSQEEGPKEKERKVEQSIESPINANPGSSLQSDVGSSLRSDVSVQMSEKNQGYIMLSYNHTHQKVVKMIRDRLRELTYDVWIDIEKMTGYVKSTMKKAVKDAGIVLICLSKKYEKSRNCKFECDRIQEYNKAFIPLIMDDFDKTNSWLEELIDDRMYVSFKEEAKLEESFTKLQKELIGNKWEDLAPRSETKSNKVGALPTTHKQGIPPTDQCTSAEVLRDQSARGDIHLPSEDKDLDEEVQHPHPNVLLPSSVQTASQPTTSVNQLQVREPRFTRMIEDISKNSGEDINIWKVALKDHIKDVNVLDKAVSTKPLLNELMRRSVLEEGDVSIILETIKLTDALHLKKYIPNCPPPKNIIITHFTKFRQSVIAFGMKLISDDVMLIAQSYNRRYRINRQYNDKWSLILDLERNAILTDDTTSLADFKSNLNMLGLQELSKLLEYSV
ncbi:uncharacterized protein LOC117124201 isoform X2 [Anneissia japonica]|uniref:uncharacterized protein LOC117124201 isoform X2 n=1 Tax=Anneissia japonica TaxID=1529436 RepID=UPI0014255F0F|nr:uncharacterized protein LOC117124201 isoform X2 [Anneissia japonica]